VATDRRHIRRSDITERFRDVGAVVVEDDAQAVLGVELLGERTQRLGRRVEFRSRVVLGLALAPVFVVVVRVKGAVHRPGDVEDGHEVSRGRSNSSTERRISPTDRYRSAFPLIGWSLTEAA